MGIVCCYDKTPTISYEKNKAVEKKDNVLDADSEVNLIEKIGRTGIES